MSEVEGKVRLAEYGSMGHVDGLRRDTPQWM
jgi:hypothetical protein